MNNELMNDEDFIRCSTMIAELLMKYKLKEDKDNGEVGMQEASPSHYFFYVENKLLIAYNRIHRWRLLTRTYRRNSCLWKMHIFIRECLR